MKKVLVTGSSGFIGRYTVENLLSKGFEVLAFDHHQEAALNRGWPDGVEVFLGDVRDDVAVTEAMAHADGWIHLAACLGTQETIKNPQPAAITNVVGGLNMLEAAAQYDLPGVYICVGNHWMNNTYSITKTTVERFCRMYNKERGTRVNMVRAMNAYGPRQLAAAPFGPGKVRKITPAFVCRALSGMPIEVYGDGNQVSDMIWVGDVAEALVRSLAHANDGDVFIEENGISDVVEIGPEVNNSVLEVAQTVNELLETTFDLPGVLIKHLPMRPGETPGDRVVADTRTLERIGMHPRTLVPLGVGMTSTIEYFIDSEGRDWHSPS